MRACVVRDSNLRLQFGSGVAMVEDAGTGGIPPDTESRDGPDDRSPGAPKKLSPEAEAAWDRLKKKLSGPPPVFRTGVLENIQKLSVEISQQSDRREAFRALVFALVRQTNPERITPTYLRELVL